MKLRERAGELLRWPGWRRCAPVAGSVATHVFLGAAIFSVLAATSKPALRPAISPAPQLEVTLVAESLPPKGWRPTPPDAPKAPPQSEVKPSTEVAPPIAKAPRKDDKRRAGERPAISGGPSRRKTRAAFISAIPILRIQARRSACADCLRRIRASPGRACRAAIAGRHGRRNSRATPTRSRPRRRSSSACIPALFRRAHTRSAASAVR